MRSIAQASGALPELARLLPSTAQRLIGETIENVAISALRDGDLVLVQPGACVPADGIVQSGKSDVTESMITGESVPVAKLEGATVIAGTVNGSGSLRVQVTGSGERTALANIMLAGGTGADVPLPCAGRGRPCSHFLDDCRRGHGRHSMRKGSKS